HSGAGDAGGRVAEPISASGPAEKPTANGQKNQGHRTWFWGRGQRGNTSGARAVKILDTGNVVVEQLAGAQLLEAVKDPVHVGVWIVAVLQAQDVADLVNRSPEEIGPRLSASLLPRIAMVVLHFAISAVANARGLRFGDRRIRRRRIGTVDVHLTKT